MQDFIDWGNDREYFMIRYVIPKYYSHFIETSSKHYVSLKYKNIFRYL